MLVNEALLEVLCWLDRLDLDAVEITSRLLSATVLASLNVYPLRDVYFTVDAGEEVSFESGRLEIKTVVKPAAFDDMVNLFRRSLVRELRFQSALDQAAFDALLPYVGAFKHAVCYAPSTFASLELIERAFSELFFCRVIRVDALRLRGSDNHWAYYYSDKEVPFLSLRCVQQCELLYVHGLGTWYGMFNVDLLGWLDSGEEKKKLTLEVPWTFVTLRIYSRRLIEALRDSTTPSEYELIMKNTNRDAWVGDYERTINDRTGEELIRTFERNEDGVMCTMQISNEVVSDALAHLTRWDLDAVAITSRKMRNVVQRHTSQRRQLYSLAIFRSNFGVEPHYRMVITWPTDLRSLEMCTMQTPTSRLCETWATALDAFVRALRVTGSTSVIQLAFLTEAVQNEATFQVFLEWLNSVSITEVLYLTNCTLTTLQAANVRRLAPSEFNTSIVDEPVDEVE